MATRRRIRSTFVQSGGGGGAPPTTGNLVWGPDFGNPPEMGVQADTDLTALALTGAHTVQAQAALTALAAVYTGPTVLAAAAMPDLALVGSHTVAAAPRVSDVAVVYEPETVIATAALTRLALLYALHVVMAAITALAYRLTAFNGSNAAVNDGPDNWTNPNNANGLANGTSATRAGQAVASTDANLRLNYVNFGATITGNFTITIVQLDYYVAQAGTALGNGGLILEYRLAVGAWTTLATYTGNVDFLAVPDSYDITAAVAGSWTSINNLEVRVRAVLGLATNLVTCSVDAVRLGLEATYQPI